MNNPKLSILVPIFGTESHIAKCARSLFSQNYDNIEYIFVNDCTKDNSIAILNSVIKEFPKREHDIKIINHKTNLGLGGARLTGLENASGEYVWFVDSDDYIDQYAVQKVLKYIQEGYEMISFSYYEQQEGKLVENRIKNVTIENVLSFIVYPSIWKNIIKKSIMISNDIKPVVGIDYAEDFHLFLRLVLIVKKSITLSNDFLYVYNLDNSDSIMHNIKLRHIENYAKACCIVVDFYRNNNSIKRYKTYLCNILIGCYFQLCLFDNKNSSILTIATEIQRIDYMLYILIKFPFHQNLKRKLASYYLSILRKL